MTLAAWGGILIAGPWAGGEISTFREAILQVIQEFKPVRDYEKLNSRQLLYCLARLRALFRDTLARVILVGWPNPDVNDLKRVAEETADISDNLSWEYIDRLCELCQSPAPAMYLVWCRLEQDAIYEETSKRLKKSKVGSELLRLEGKRVKPMGLGELHKALGVERITTYRPKKYSDDDLKQIAVEGALGAFKKMGEALKVEKPQDTYPLSPLARFLPVKTEVSERWEIVNAAMERKDYTMMQEYYLPALEGKKISQRARQALKDWFEKWEARKRKGDEISLEQAKGIPSEETSRPVSSLVAKRVYKKTIDRHGEKARIYLDALPESGWKNKINIKEASELAEISRPTAYKWLKEYKREYELEIKKPTKPRK